MRTEVLLYAKKNGFAAEQIRFSNKLEWIEVDGKLALRKARIDRRAKTITIFVDAIEANYPKVFKEHTLEILGECIKTLGNGQWDEDEHPRDDDGKFTHGGGGSTSGNDGADAAVVGANEPELHPEIVKVGGDDWNQETAIKLEKEYQTAKPDLEALIHKNVGEEVDTAVDEDDLHENAPYVPDSWEGLSDSQQEDVKSAWKENTKQEFLDSEENNWIDNGGQKDDAQALVAYEFSSSDPNFDWARDTISDWKAAREEEGKPVPYDTMTLVDSLQIEYEPNGEGTGKVSIDFDNSLLQSPIGYDPNQLLLPGIEPVDPSSFLDDEMREELTKELEKAFDTQADELISDGKVETPDYIGEQVDEYQDEYWDSKDDSEKFKYAEDNTDIISDAQQEYDEYYENNGQSGGADEVAIPNTFDPLQNTGDSVEYKKTHALVTFMSRERGIQLLQQRGLVDKDRPTSDYRGDVKDVDNDLWRSWKESSAGSFGGQVLQLASAEELGARYREMPKARQDIIEQANSRYKEIGGFAGVKALVRAKWETSQYALDKAGVNSLVVYRGLRVEMPSDEPTQKVEAEHWKDPNGVSGSKIYERFTDAQITRNGMYSTTTSREVANGWNAGHGTKVVLRLDVPRTAVVSFPAYGINVHSEKEVVVAGTAFRGWDAWKNNAPSYGDVPMFNEKKTA